jgi:hypothetical protein
MVQVNLQVRGKPLRKNSAVEQKPKGRKMNRELATCHFTVGEKPRTMELAKLLAEGSPRLQRTNRRPAKSGPIAWTTEHPLERSNKWAVSEWTDDQNRPIEEEEQYAVNQLPQKKKLQDERKTN